MTYLIYIVFRTMSQIRDSKILKVVQMIKINRLLGRDREAFIKI